MKKEKEQERQLNAVKHVCLGEGIATTLNPSTNRPNRNLEEGTETGIPEGPLPMPVYSQKIKKTYPLLRKPARKEEREVIGITKSRRQIVNTFEDDLYQPWTCEERNPFTLRIRHFSLPRTRMPSHVKTYDGSGDPEDHLKLFQSAAKTEGWAMPTWCHMFNSTLTGNARVWFDKLPKESIDSYEDLRTAFRENYLQQTKHIKDPVEIHHIKQRDGESTEDFMERYKAEVLDVEGAPECMRISGFMHGITHPGLIKRLYERIPRSVDEMYRMTTSFLQGEVAALSHGRRKASSSWKPSEGGDKPTFKKGFKNKQRPDRKPDRFSLLTNNSKGNFRSGEKESSMLHPNVAMPRITRAASPRRQQLSFPPLSEEDGTESPMTHRSRMGGTCEIGPLSPYRIQRESHLEFGSGLLTSNNRQDGHRKSGAVPSTAPRNVGNFSPVEGGTAKEKRTGTGKEISNPEEVKILVVAGIMKVVTLSPAGI
ncbi:reverse transcriptase domain-containing protein [Tanacetum coccineum]